MATMVTSTRPVTKKGVGGGSKFPGPGGNGSGKPNGNGKLFPDDSRASRYRIGMWVGIASIFMMFTALTSAYIVRAASANDWKPLPMPRILLLSTALIIISSVTVEVCRRKLKAGRRDGYVKLLFLTMALGFGFLFSQLAAWKELVRQGVYVASNPHSSFFYLLTGAHGVHLFGGLIALIYVAFRWHAKPDDKISAAKNVAAVEAFSIYWHFMDGLWLYLFLLLFFWR
jgi:cytochrome c oxidase subunit III